MKIITTIRWAGLGAVVALLAAPGLSEEVSKPPPRTGVEKRIIKAIEAGDLEQVQSLWTDEVDVNRRFAYWPHRYLFGAAASEHSKTVAWLIERGADVNVTSGGKEPYTPIHVAAKHARIENAKLLAKHGATLDPLSAVAVNDPAGIRRFVATDSTVLKRTWHFSRISSEETLLHFAAAYGHVDAIRTLIELGADVMGGDEDGFTALYLAAAWTKADAVAELLKHDQRVNRTNRYGWSPLRAAAYYGGNDAADVLLKAGAKLDVFSATGLGRLDDVERFVKADPDVLTETVGGDTPLAWAVAADQPKAVKRLIELGANVNAHEQNMENAPLQKAAWANHVECAKVLIDAGANLNVGQGQDAYGPPLHHAAWNGHDEMVKLLIDAGANIEAVDNTSDSPLVFAVGQQRIDTVKLLLARGANPNGVGTSPPLARCVDHDDTQVAKLLLEAGANPMALTRSSGSALHLAIKRGNTALTALLLSQPLEDKDIRGENRTTLLHLAPLARDTSVTWRIKLIDRLLEMGFDLETTSYGGFTVLARAIHNRKEPRIIEHLIKKGAKVDATTSRGSSALHLACSSKQVDVVKLLLKHGAKADVKDKRGRGPLSAVVADVSKESEQIAQMLLEAGAPVDVMSMAFLGWDNAVMATVEENPGILTEAGGKTLLHATASRGNLKLVKFLLSKGATLDGRDETGMTAMHRAALGNKPAVVAYLLEQGADADQASHYQHALYSAAIAGSVEITQMLIDAGATVDRKTRYQYTALNQAASAGKLEVVKTLVAAGADVNLVMKNNETPVTAAIDRGRLEVLKFLVASGGRLEGVGDDYSPPLHDAANLDSPDVMAFLLEQGLWVNRPNERGDTALDWAMPDDPHNVKLLREAGGLPGHLVYRDPKIAKLLEALDAPEYEARAAADAALREIGRGLRPALARYLKLVESPEVKVRLEEMIRDFAKEAEAD